MVTRRNFIATAAAAVAAPVHTLAAPIGGALRVPAGFTKGKAIPEGFDFRDPFSGLFMSFSLWYVIDETGTAREQVGCENPGDAYLRHLQAELVEHEKHLASLLAGNDNPEFYTEAQHAGRIESAKRWVAEIKAEMLKKPNLAKFGGEEALCGIELTENYMGCNVMRGDMAYTFARNYSRDESMGGDAEMEADFDRAQVDPQWNWQWGGGG